MLKLSGPEFILEHRHKTFEYNSQFDFFIQTDLGPKTLANHFEGGGK